jgi:hypothetical protein
MLNVFTYWEHAPKARRWPYIEFCLDTIRSKCLDGCLFHHITSENIDKYIPDGILHPSWKNIKELGVKSDCVRAACLMLYGGLYIDADTLMLRSPKELDTGHECGFMTWTTPPHRVIAGYIYCCAGSEVAKKWVANINEMLEQGRCGWTDLGERCLTPAVDASQDTVHWPLQTFLPIDIDKEVRLFFGTTPWRLPDESVAVGLNHSLMTRKFAGEMRGVGHESVSFKYRSERSRLTIHRLFNKSRTSQTEPKIGVCVPTFRRPKLLGHLIACFENQSYENRRLIAYDDHGEMTSGGGDRWEIVSDTARYKTLGEKRNAIVRMMPECDAYVMWDDDDLFLPHALQSIADGLRRADFVRPSTVLARHGNSLIQTEAFWREDRSDKAYQGAWGFTRSAFDAAGGYESVSLGEDLLLAKKFRDLRISECDPISELGCSPWAIAAPHENEHFSWKCKNYAEWKLLARSAGQFHVENHPFAGLPVLDKVMKRPWSGDWYQDEVR